MTKDLRFKNKKENVGFTLLYASMIAGLLLAIGAAILSITVKQISLSAAGRESQFAFYNADTGTECAVYWYRTSKTGICPAGLFPPKSDSTNDQSCTNISSNPPKCLGLALTDKYGGQITSFAQTGLYSFSITSQGANNICFSKNNSTASGVEGLLAPSLTQTQPFAKSFFASSIRPNDLSSTIISFPFTSPRIENSTLLKAISSIKSSSFSGETETTILP